MSRFLLGRFMLALYFALQMKKIDGSPFFSQASLVRVAGIDHMFVQTICGGVVGYIDSYKFYEDASKGCYLQEQFSHFNQDKEINALEKKFEVHANDKSLYKQNLLACFRDDYLALCNKVLKDQSNVKQFENDPIFSKQKILRSKLFPEVRARNPGIEQQDSECVYSP